MSKNPVLSMDIGGTNCRIGIFKNKRIIRKKYYPTKKIKNFSKKVSGYLKKNSKYKIKKAGIGFAGPIIGNIAELTNADLKINRKKLEKQLNLKITIINDFHALGYGISLLKKKDLFEISKPKFKNDIKMVVGPGTGLGKAYIVHKLVFPGEGGQTLIGIEDIHDYALVDYLTKEFGKPVYYEDVLSGRGIINLYKHLAIKTSYKRNHKAGEKIKKKLLKSAEMVTKYSSKDELCDITLKEFTKYFARFTRDSALHLIPCRIYLSGGISPEIKKYIKKYFIKEFTKHRSYSDLLKKIGISVILNTDTGLLGAGFAAK
ncbi:ROK family protein [Candidatus Woesearchaeota archaeon]|nr:ROK family protein [Candidatus Woesearchaeota archaeon]